MTTTVYIIRHAEAEGNVYRRCHGQYDALLTTRAYKQLPYLAKRFENVPLTAVYASDLFRARVTAQAVAEPHHLSVQTRKVLREIDMGDWEDIPWAELPHTWPEQYALWCARPWEAAPPHGETVMQAGQRMLDGVKALAHNHPGEEIAVVTHGSAIRGMLTIAHGFAPEQMGEIGWGDNTCVAKLEIDKNGAVEVVYENDASHLPQEYSTFASIGWTNTKGIRLRRRSGSVVLTQRIHRMWIKLWASCVSCIGTPTARMRIWMLMRSSAMWSGPRKSRRARAASAVWRAARKSRSCT